MRTHGTPTPADHPAGRDVILPLIYVCVFIHVCRFVLVTFFTQRLKYMFIKCQQSIKVAPRIDTLSTTAMPIAGG